jgi:hypothetical protein
MIPSGTRIDNFGTVRAPTGVTFYAIQNFPRKAEERKSQKKCPQNPFVVSAANANHRAYALCLVDSLRQWQVDYEFYDLGELGFGTPFNGAVSERPYQNIPCKPLIMLEASLGLRDGQLLIWLDSDTILTGDITLLSDCYDLCVTLRKVKSQKEQESWVNAGVIALRVSKNTRKFLKLWAKVAEIKRGDQAALNLLLFDERYKKSRPQFYQNLSVAGLPVEVFNNYEAELRNPCIVRHFKADIRGFHPVNSLNDIKYSGFPAVNNSEKKNDKMARNSLLKRLHQSWERDHDLLNIHPSLKNTYFNSLARFYSHFKRIPDLKNPVTFNEKMQWLKLFEVRGLKVACSDKIEMRSYISSILGPGFTPRIYKIGENYDEIMSAHLPEGFILKSSHDSGTVFEFGPNGFDISSDYQKIAKICASSLSSHYGWDKGEWPYRFLRPRLLIEENIAGGKSPVDFKFHCVNGHVSFAQVIWDRKTLAKEAIFSRDGDPLNIRLDHLMAKGNFGRLPENYCHAIDIAELVARPFYYVRVDIYIIEDKIYVGELTFFPRGGYYHGLGEVALGAQMNLQRNPHLDDRILYDSRWQSGAVV